jgi:hypothetical protein
VREKDSFESKGGSEAEFFTAGGRVVVVGEKGVSSGFEIGAVVEDMILMPRGERGEKQERVRESGERGKRESFNVWRIVFIHNL